MRPKSMATVVEVLRSETRPASSTPIECSVIAASVRSGSMSDSEPMKVVLPTEKPTATTILTTVGGASGVPAAAAEPGASAGVPCGATSERGNAIENTLQDAEAGCGGRGLREGADPVDAEVAGLGQVADQDPHDPDGQVHVGRELGDGQVLRAGELEDLATLGRQAD